MDKSIIFISNITFHISLFQDLLGLSRNMFDTPVHDGVSLGVGVSVGVEVGVGVGVGVGQ